MKKVFLLLSVLAGLLLIVGSCAQPQVAEAPPPHEEETVPAEEAHPSSEEATFRVEVSRLGFNNTPGEYHLEVEAGQEVTITFVYGDNDFPEDNPHIISIPELGIITGVLDLEHPEATVSFTLQEDEKVSFVCFNDECIGHANLLGGAVEADEHGH